MAIDFAKLLAAHRTQVVENNAAPQVQSSPLATSPVATPPPPPEKKESVGAAPVSPASQVIQPTTMPVSASPTAEAGATIEYPGLYELRERILALEKALLANHPAMDSLLQTIHRNLQKDPELVHILKAEDRAIIFAGLQKKTQTKIVSDTVKSAGSGKNKGLKNLGLEDL